MLNYSPHVSLNCIRHPRGKYKLFLQLTNNPPYQRTRDRKSDLAIEFYNKCVKLQPQVIVYYFKMERFLSDDINYYIKSGYKIQSHVFSNAKTTFLLSEWPISQVIFDKDNGTDIDKNRIVAERYEYDRVSDMLCYVKQYAYNADRKNFLIFNIDDTIFENSKGMELGHYVYLQDVLRVSNKPKVDKKQRITVKNLKYCLLSKGLNFNTNDKYFEHDIYVSR